jgi:hypothetical protein
MLVDHLRPPAIAAQTIAIGKVCRLLHVRRVKNGTPSTHPLLGDELRTLRRLQRESQPSPFVFVSERGSPAYACESLRTLRLFPGSPAPLAPITGPAVDEPGSGLYFIALR